MSGKSTFHIDEKKFAELYEHHWQDLYLTCNRYINEPEIAKGIVQNLFISIWERRDKLNIHTSFEGYLHQSLKLKIVEHYRRQSVRTRYREQKSAEPLSMTNNTQEHILYRELLDALNTAVDSLPERCRQVYLMSRESGMDNKTIASTLVITEKAVEGNMTRALSYIRARLKAFRL